MDTALQVENTNESAIAGIQHPIINVHAVDNTAGRNGVERYPPPTIMAPKPRAIDVDVANGFAV